MQLLESNPDIATFFTDGSFDQESGRAGSALVCGEHVYTSRISNHSSISQAELFANKGALSHALSLPQELIYILTDSLSALHTLQKFPEDNIHLISTTLFRLQQLIEQGKSIYFMWIPSYSGIDQNDLPDRAAKDSLSQIQFTVLQPSISYVKKLAKTTSYQVSRIHHQVWVHAGSFSAQWYQTVTEYDPLPISEP